jgi:hypothetical protein
MRPPVSQHDTYQQARRGRAHRRGPPSRRWVRGQGPVGKIEPVAHPGHDPLVDDVVGGPGAPGSQVVKTLRGARATRPPGAVSAVPRSATGSGFTGRASTSPATVSTGSPAPGRAAGSSTVRGRELSVGNRRARNHQILARPQRRQPPGDSAALIRSARWSRTPAAGGGAARGASSATSPVTRSIKPPDSAAVPVDSTTQSAGSGSATGPARRSAGRGAGGFPACPSVPPPCPLGR